MKPCTKKTVCIVLAFSLIFTVLFVLIIGRKVAENKAIRLAQEFVDKKYGENRMIYTGDVQTFLEGPSYVIYFSPEDDSDLSFGVYVCNQHWYGSPYINDDRIDYEKGIVHSSDSYLLAKFERDMTNRLKEFCCDSDISISANVIDDAVYYFTIPLGLTEKTDFVSEEKMINYGLYIDIKTNNLSEQAITDSILNLFEQLRSNKISPKYISIYFDDSYINKLYDKEWKDIITAQDLQKAIGQDD